MQNEALKVQEKTLQPTTTNSIDFATASIDPNVLKTFTSALAAIQMANRVANCDFSVFLLDFD